MSRKARSFFGRSRTSFRNPSVSVQPAFNAPPINLILPNRNSEAEMIRTRTKLIGATIAVIGFTIPFSASAHERHDPWLTAAGVALTYAHYSDHADRHYHGHRWHHWRAHDRHGRGHEHERDRRGERRHRHGY